MPNETPDDAERWVPATVGLLFVSNSIAIVYSFAADLSVGAFAVAAVTGWPA